MDGGAVFASDALLVDGEPVERPRLDRGLHGTDACYRLYETQGDGWIQIAAVKESEWVALCGALTLAEIAGALPKTGGYDSLVGKSYSDIYGELREVKAKLNTKTHTCKDNESKDCLMAVHAKPYTDKELQDIAWYLSQR